MVISPTDMALYKEEEYLKKQLMNVWHKRKVSIGRKVKRIGSSLGTRTLNSFMLLSKPGKRTTILIISSVLMVLP